MTVQKSDLSASSIMNPTFCVQKNIFGDSYDSFLTNSSPTFRRSTNTMAKRSMPSTIKKPPRLSKKLADLYPFAIRLGSLILSQPEKIFQEYSSGMKLKSVSSFNLSKRRLAFPGKLVFMKLMYTISCIWLVILTSFERLMDINSWSMNEPKRMDFMLLSTVVLAVSNKS